MTNADGNLCPSNLLECPKLSELNYWLSRFVVEAHRENEDSYPARTLTNLLAGLYHRCQECDAACLNFMNCKDPLFKELNVAIQVRSIELHESGVGAVVNHAAVIAEQEEHELWESKVIGNHNPVVLQRAAFFYIGKAFCLRGSQEQHNLKPSQFLHFFRLMACVMELN